MKRTDVFWLVVELKFVSLLAALLPSYLAWAGLSFVLGSHGVPNALLDRLFVQSLDKPHWDLMGVLTWLGLAFFATVLVESAYLRWKFRRAPLAEPPLRIAFRSNRVVFVGLALVSSALTWFR